MFDGMPTGDRAEALASEIVSVHDMLKQNRTASETRWREAESFCLEAGPQNDDVHQQDNATNIASRLFDAQPIFAVERFGSLLQMMVFPEAERWHGLTTGDRELDRDPEIAEYRDAYLDVMFRERYDPRSGFAVHILGLMMGQGMHGTVCMCLDPRPGGGFMYKAIPIREIVFATDANGDRSYVIRRFTQTARQAVQRVKWRDALPETIREAASDPKKSNEKFWFQHCVRPRTGFDPEAMDERRMRFESIVVSEADKKLLNVGGAYEQPYQISRYKVLAGEDWGRSAIASVMPDVRMLNEHQRIMIDGAAMDLDPTLLMPDDWIDPAHIRAGGRVPGGIDEDGRPVVQQLDIRRQWQPSLEMQDQKRSMIDDALLGRLLQVLMENPQMTATQAQLLAYHYGQMAAPFIARQHAELAEPMIRRESGILSRQGRLPVMPERLQEYLESRGQGMRLTYMTEMLRAQRSGAAIALSRTFEQLAPWREVRPDIFKPFKASAIAATVVEANGVPGEVLMTDEELAAAEAQDQQAAAAEQALQAAPVAAKTAKDLAALQAGASNQPSAVAPGLGPLSVG